MTPSRNVVAVTDEMVELAARAICKHVYLHPNRDWQSQAPLARAALSAAYPSMVAEVERLTKALGAIARADPIDLALDPEWPQRVARAALTEAKT